MLVLKYSYFILVILIACGRNEDYTNYRNPAANAIDVVRGDGNSLSNILADTYDNLTDLPKCDVEKDNILVFVRADNRFYICENLIWSAVIIANQVAGGNDSNKGDKGDRGLDGDQGEVGYSSLSIVSKEEAGTNCLLGGNKMQIGLDNGDGGGFARNGILEASEIDQTVYICQKGVGVFDKNSSLLGSRFPLKSNLSAVTIMFTNNGFADFNNETGKFVNSFGLVGDEVRGAACWFRTTDCTGTCYAADLSRTDVDNKPFKNAIFYTGNSFVRSSGNDLRVDNIDVQSRFSNGICEQNSPAIAINHAYEITEIFTLPNGLLMPLSPPFYYESIE